MQGMPYTAAVMLRLLAAALVAVLMLGPSVAPAQTPGPTVVTDAGRLAGTVDDAGMRAFRGIPFAAPPVGDLRWREPQPVAHWDGVRDASDFGDRCQQSPFPPTTPIGKSGMSENCLFLNVWTAPTAARAPVLVWIYGGGYSNGYANAADYDGDAFAQKGLVFVSLNYRVGAFGFLAHPALTQESPHKTSGNYAILDQIAALQWVRRNIAAFGGDPNNVTVFGESAGSVSVSVLTASPLAKGLFERAIGDSGAGLGSTVDTLPVKPLAWEERRGLAFAEMLHAHTAAELRAIPAAQIVDAGEHGAGTLFLGGRFAPVIDGYVLREAPERTFARGAQNNVSLLTGWNIREGLLFTLLDPKGDAAVGCKPVWDDARTAAAFVEQASRSFGAAAPAFLELSPHATDDEARLSAENTVGDLTIDWATWKWADLQSKSGKTSVYTYLFAKVPPAEYPLHAATHGSETLYAFDNLKAHKWSWAPMDMQIAHLMSSYYANFARTGDPNGPGLPPWPAYTGATPQRMVFDANGAAAAPASLARVRLIDANRSAGPWCPDAK
jgi:para-nitrobenzyl esterase